MDGQPFAFFGDWLAPLLCASNIPWLLSAPWFLSAPCKKRVSACHLTLLGVLHLLSLVDPLLSQPFVMKGFDDDKRKQYEAHAADEKIKKDYLEYAAREESRQAVSYMLQEPLTRLHAGSAHAWRRSLNRGQWCAHFTDSSCAVPGRLR